MKAKNKKMPSKKNDRVFHNTALTLVTLLVASLLCEVLYRLGVGEQNISIVMILAVFLIAASTPGYWYGLAATVVGVLVYDYLVTEPRFGFSFTLGFPITLSIMVLVALATSTITARIKKQTELAQEKERRAELLYEINRKLLSSRDEGTIARYAMEYLKNDLDRSVALFPSFENDEALSFYFRQAEGDVSGGFFSAPGEQAATRMAFSRKTDIGPGAVRLEGSSGYYRPIITQGEVYGVFGFSGREGPIAAAHIPFWIYLPTKPPRPCGCRH